MPCGGFLRMRTRGTDFLQKLISSNLPRQHPPMCFRRQRCKSSSATRKALGSTSNEQEQDTGTVYPSRRRGNHSLARRRRREHKGSHRRDGGEPLPRYAASAATLNGGLGKLRVGFLLFAERQIKLPTPRS